MYSSASNLKKTNIKSILNESKSHDLPFVNLTCSNSAYKKHFRAYLDSCANFSLIRKDLFQKFSLQFDSSDVLKYSVADNRSVTSLGSTFLDLPQFAGHNTRFKFQVVDSLVDLNWAWAGAE